MMSLMSLSGENSDTKVQSSAASARPPQTPPASSYRQRRNRRCHRPFDARRARCPSSPRVAAPAAIGPAQSCDPISCILSVHPLSLNSRWPAVYPILTQWAMRECHRAWTSSRSAWTSCRTAAHRTALQVSWLTAAPRPHVAEAGRCEDDVGLKLTKSTDAQQEYECSGRKCQHPAQKSTAPAARKGLEAVKPHHLNGFVWHWSPEVWAWDPAAGPWEARYGGPRAPVYFEVSNAHVAPAQAYEFWCAHAFYNFEPDPPRAAEKFAFRAEARSLYSPRAQLHTYRSDPLAGSRSKRHAKADSGTLIDIGLVI